MVASLALLAARPLLMVHVMPWFALNPPGWHWTMGSTDAAKGRIAAHERPLGGIYDSGDPDVVERQTLLMKVAGFDGMLVDWYGDRDRFDYLANHRNAQRLFEAARRTGLSFAVVYEDATVANLVAGGVFAKADEVAQGKALFERARRAWFGSPNYQKIGGKPLVMVFGPQHYADGDWPRILPDAALYTLHHRRAGALGAFDWPLPGEGWKARRAEIEREPSLIPVAFPRFDDFYKAAGVGAGYGRIPDDDGETYRATLDEAIRRGPPLVQVATWNDWGEGTQIEPSVEHGVRDLVATQNARRRLDRGFLYVAADLDLPLRLYELRKAGASRARLDRAADEIRAGQTHAARRLLASLP